MDQRASGRLPRVGELVELALEQEPPHKTRVEDIDDAGQFVVSQPLYREIPVVLHPGQPLQFIYFRANGLFSFAAKVTGVVTNDQIKLYAIQRIAEPIKLQRRESYRLPILLDAVVRPASAGPFPFHPTAEDDLLEQNVTTEDISETGMAFRSLKMTYEVGEKVYVRFSLHWPSPNAKPIDLRCEVRRCVEVDPIRRLYCVGLMFLDCGESTRQHIARFVLTRQQEQLRMS